MKLFVISVVLLHLIGCNSNNQASEESDLILEIPDDMWGIEETFYDRKSSLWKFKNDSSRVSGNILSYFQNGIISESIPVLAGKKEGIHLTYFSNGELKFFETYKNNKLHGTTKRWGIQEGYQLLAELNYVDGRLHGEQRKWFASGELHKLMYMNNGKEHGMQKAFRKNGVLYANYEAINGRTFGLKRTELCFELNDGQVVFK